MHYYLLCWLVTRACEISPSSNEDLATLGPSGCLKWRSFSWDNDLECKSNLLAEKAADAVCDTGAATGGARGWTGCTERTGWGAATGLGTTPAAGEGLAG